MKEDVKEVLLRSRIEGNNLYLPENLDRKLYQDVNKQITAIGGKWKGGKVMAHIYPSDSQALLEELISGGFKDPKKEFQMFYTSK